MPNPTDLQAFSSGVAVADAGGDSQLAAQNLAEEAMVKSWFERIDSARKHDEEAYKQLARDRMYARGDTSFTTRVNVIGSYIDTWVSLLYARDPDIDCLPDESMSKTETHTARDFGKTAQIVVSKQWRATRLKRQAERWVRAALTSKIGWLKSTWQERKGFDPVTARAICDLQDNLLLVQQKIREMEHDQQDFSSLELKQEQLKLAIQGLHANTEAMVRKGMVSDPVDMADITVSEESPNIGSYLEAPWISHRIYMRREEAISTFTQLKKEDWTTASCYSPKKPVASILSNDGSLAEVSAEDADSYKVGQLVRESGAGGLVCIEEVWDRTMNQIIWLVRGINKYARAPKPPYPGTSRFYPFFGLSFTEVDGQRWAQSLNERSQTLQDAFSRIISQLETHRKRIKPKTMFQAGNMDTEEAKKLEGGSEQEMVPVKTTNPKMDLRGLLVPVTYAAVDMAVYDTHPILQQFELVWGLQEAMTAEVSTAKTATESEIQQTGTMSRTGSKRDTLEEVLSDLAQYHLECDIQCMSIEDVQKVAGAGAIWPQGENGEPITLEDLGRLASIKVRAGSSGKPNTKAMRDAWSVTLPLLQGLITEIAKLRLSNPLEIAEKLEELVTETAARSGENLDVIRFIPQVGKPLQLIDPTTMQVVLAYPAPDQPTAPGQPGGQTGAPAKAAAVPASNGDHASQPIPSANGDASGAPVPDAGLPT